MRLPTVENYRDDSTHVVKKIDSIEPFEFSVNLFTEKDRIKFIKTIERIVRASMEYKEYIKYLKENVDMTSCSFFYNIDSKNARKGKVRIEIHHEPFTLFDIVDIVLNKHQQTESEVTYMGVSDEVMKLHYRNLVGLIPLSVTVHELVHSGKIFVPLSHIYGNFIKFVEEYKNYIPDYLNDILKEKIKLTDGISDNTVLNKKFVYLDVEGFNLPHRIE